MSRLATLICLSLALALPPAVRADAAPAAASAAAASDAEKPKETSSATRHSLSLNGQSLSYTATAGTLLIKNDKDEPTASMFYVAYTLDGVKDLRRRPVTFLFNGGPGSSSMWLHMGSFAPVHVLTVDGQATPPAPYQLVDNPNSLLDKTDLVFVDAIGTGFSKTVGKGEGKDFYGVDQDIQAFGQFIQRYVGLNGRWNSPKFLLGESYGTTRAAGLASWLQQKDLSLNGIVLVSSWLIPYDGLFGPAYAIDEQYELVLPTMAATAWYHDKLSPKPADLAKFLDEVRAFALGDYATALAKGSKLGAAERQAVAQKLAAYTGLSSDYVLKANLRVTAGRFEKELLRDQGRTTGQLDARFLGIDIDSVGEFTEYDAADAAFGPVIVGAFNDYVRSQLNFGKDLVYKPTSYDVGNDWDWHHQVGGQKYPLFDVAEDLRQAMTQNPHLLVFSANGYFDFATPFFQTEYTLDHMGLDPTLVKNIRYAYYPSGHMIYMHPDAAKTMKSDLAKFYDEATTQ